MKKITILLTIMTILTGLSFASSKKIQASSTTKETITVLDKGVKRQIAIPINSSKQTNSAQQSDTKDGVIVVFKNPATVSISEFETKYGLKLKSKLVIGYYIFENISSMNDVSIVSDIIANENSVKTVKPNWKKRKSIR